MYILDRLLYVELSFGDTKSLPYDAKPFLAKARGVLQDIAKILKEVKLFEDKLIKLTKEEKGILKKERDVN